jgi:hypothetical protein
MEQSASWSPLFDFRELLEVPVTIMDHVISMRMPFPQNWNWTCCLECFSQKITNFLNLSCHLYTTVTVCSTFFHCPRVSLCSGINNQLPKYCVICCWSESLPTSWPFHEICICLGLDAIFESIISENINHSARITPFWALHYFEYSVKNI